MILPSAKGKLRKQRKMRDVSKYNSPLASAEFFFPDFVEMKMSFVHVSAVIPKPLSREITEGTPESHFIHSGCVP